jgi:hypothetical protein
MRQLRRSICGLNLRRSPASSIGRAYQFPIAQRNAFAIGQRHAVFLPHSVLLHSYDQRKDAEPGSMHQLQGAKPLIYLEPGRRVVSLFDECRKLLRQTQAF